MTAPDPSVRPDLWPWATARDMHGRLHIGGVDLSLQPTPSYVTSLDDLGQRAQVWASAMAEEFWKGYGFAGASVFYVAKAQVNASILKVVTAAGCGVSTASFGELTLALKAGVDPALIVLHGNNKSDAELELAVRSGIGRIIIDSADEVARVTEIAQRLDRVANVMLSVSADMAAGMQELSDTDYSNTECINAAYRSAAPEDQNFGLPIANGAAVQSVHEICKQQCLRFIGLHSHIGPQIVDVKCIRATASAVLEMRAQLLNADIDVAEINLSGDYALAYSQATEPAPSPVVFARELATIVREKCAELGTSVPHICVESGSSIAGPATVTLYRVGAIKDVKLAESSRRCVSVDGGISDNPHQILFNVAYTATLVNRAPTGETVLCRLVGKHGESGDVLISDIELPSDLCRGDILAVPVTGAYGRAMASNYNMALRPPVIGIEAGKARVILRGDTIEDLLALDPGLD